MRKIGITGSIGSGKSLVGSILRENGLEVMDADKAVHELYRENLELRRKISAAFGMEALASDGVNRQFFARLIFENDSARCQLESIVYPFLTEKVDAFFKAPDGKENFAKARFLEAALLNRVPEICSMLDEVWVVTAPEKVRLDRLVKRGLDAQDAQRRIVTQREYVLPANLPVVEIENAHDKEALVKAVQARVEFLNQDKF